MRLREAQSNNDTGRWMSRTYKAQPAIGVDAVARSAEPVNTRCGCGYPKRRATPTP
jgi:hypothetical protein